MKHKIAVFLASKILPAAKRFVYNHGFTPKKGTILYSNPLAIDRALRRYAHSLGHHKRK